MIGGYIEVTLFICRCLHNRLIIRLKGYAKFKTTHMKPCPDRVIKMELLHTYMLIERPGCNPVP